MEVIGGTLGRQLARLGHKVLIANSRGPENLTALAAEIGATPATIFEATRAADIVIVAIPTKAVTALPRGFLAKAHSSVVVVDTGNYHPELRDGRIDAIDGGLLESEWVAQQLGHPVFKAFNNIFAHCLLEKATPAGTMGRIALSVAGHPLDARNPVLRLVDDLGFDPVDGGGLDDSWRQQPGRLRTVRISTPWLLGTRSSKPIAAGWPNTVPKRRLASGGQLGRSHSDDRSCACIKGGSGIWTLVVAVRSDRFPPLRNEQPRFARCVSGRNSVGRYGMRNDNATLLGRREPGCAHRRRRITGEC